MTRSQRWNGRFYENVKPKDLELDIQLGHPPGMTCPMRSYATVNEFSVIHTNGVRVYRMFFCKCRLSAHIPRFAQLLRRRLWPATCSKPESATTFESLDIFHRLSLYGKLNAYDFVRAVTSATDGALLGGVAVGRLTHLHETPTDIRFT